uniref:Uncharacterized protein n=1 Tax=Anguilla anguilla TaxID=7936 RepID=A0A0E9QRZ0_ANGAN
MHYTSLPYITVITVIQQKRLCRVTYYEAESEVLSPDQYQQYC